MKKFSDSTSLIGAKVVLREMIEDDAETVVKWRNDKDIRKWMFNQEEITLKEHSEWFSNRSNRIDYMICDVEGGLPIGTLNFINMNGAVAEAGKMLGNKNYWGGGYAKEAFVLWLNFGFNNMELEEIYVQTMSNNEPNIGLNTKLGFKLKEVYGKKIGNERFGVTVMSLDKISFKYLR